MSYVCPAIRERHIRGIACIILLCRK